MSYTPEDGFPYYFVFVKEGDLYMFFSSVSTFTFLKSISEEKAAYLYSPGKWSIKQIVGHITDHERIKCLEHFN